MTPEELAAIRERDAAWPVAVGEMPTLGSLARDRRALLAHIDALEAAVRSMEAMAEFYEWDAIPFKEHGLPEKHVIEALALLRGRP